MGSSLSGSCFSRIFLQTIRLAVFKTGPRLDFMNGAKEALLRRQFEKKRAVFL
jgi:hypothetical protein